MDKLKMHSPDLSQENIAKIRELFPGCVTEARDDKTGKLRLAVDFDQLKQELSDHIVEGAAGALSAGLAGEARGTGTGQRADCQGAAAQSGGKRRFRQHAQPVYRG